MIHILNINRLIHTHHAKLAKSSISFKETSGLIAQSMIRTTNHALIAHSYWENIKKNNKDNNNNSEYRQIPDDSRFMDKHYNELINYRDKIVGVGGSFNDLNSITELFFKLSKLYPNEGKPEQIELFNKFIDDLWQLLMLNGGYIDILDLMIYNKQVFDHCESTKHHV
ncbi:hypothetical protein DAPK24_054830 [Pichia kluyveri]|uniref:Uncharacterized protein n=1 Tax=Pichia kluyveri TaxID=36015 RepID=A0AAV5RC62_PICKL|nr:hypothetical protein DAPK24_054830 [Pichia kluyveri]